MNYVEMLGSGTQAGGGIEMQYVSNTFAPIHRERRPDQPLYLAIKANISQEETTFGVYTLIKALLNGNSPHCSFKGTMNKSFLTDLLEQDVTIALKKNYLRKHARNTVDFLSSPTLRRWNNSLT